MRNESGVSGSRGPLFDWICFLLSLSYTIELMMIVNVFPPLLLITTVPQWSVDDLYPISLIYKAHFDEDFLIAIKKKRAEYIQHPTACIINPKLRNISQAESGGDE